MGATLSEEMAEFPGPGKKSICKKINKSTKFADGQAESEYSRDIIEIGPVLP